MINLLIFTTIILSCSSPSIIEPFQDTVNDKKVEVLSSTYFVDAKNGNDLNLGTSPDKAWKSLEHINKQTFGPGAKLLFKAGDSWYGSLIPKGSGTEGKVFEIGKYGDGTRPAIHGDGTNAAIHLNNMEYLLLRDLEITNYNSSEEGGISLKEWERRNVTDWADAINPDQHVSGNNTKFGIKISAKDMGEVSHIHLINLEVHGVNGAIDQSKESTKHNGGIFIEITGNSIPTWFNDLRIENCYIHDVDRTGVSNVSSWSNRTFTSLGDWTPSENLVIRNNLFERSGANALIVRVALNPLIERNLFHQNGIKASGNAAFNFNTDGALWQYNEARFTKKNKNDADAGGLDSDYKSKNTIIQYNYLHDNDFGMLVTGGPKKTDGSNFNDRTIVRYNIFERDGLVKRDGEIAFAFKVGGNATNTFVHNNVFYLSKEQSDVNMVYHRSWNGYPDRTSYFNNIFYFESTGHSYELTNSTNNSFTNNLYYGNNTVSWHKGEGNIFDDPKFSNPGNGTEGYRIKSTSPAKGNGIRSQNILFPLYDFYNNPINNSSIPDIGIHQLIP
ncbi:MAG: hypothetical protein PHV89_06725 [Fermentimonas sp.]|nr:hypothetical protein [Fermentimonas sp.]MDD2930830.1 hypothetical protein [Fermentimonas sp.]MDD3511474.1 hypothetical protein [Fermentimonas sp.]MDD4284154.1 hypothetical protein [Fermentimonas sp.]MDD4724455.1 hypothetical protein [Fermentimonas sp.]